MIIYYYDSQAPEAEEQVRAMHELYDGQIEFRDCSKSADLMEDVRTYLTGGNDAAK